MSYLGLMDWETVYYLIVVEYLERFWRKKLIFRMVICQGGFSKNKWGKNYIRR